MNAFSSKRFQQQSVVVLATVGLTAAIALAAVGPNAMRTQAPAAAAEVTTVGVMKAPALNDANAPHFERSDEPAIEVDLVKPYGG